ncbi:MULTISPECIES: nitrate reductase molybdenum cofactor assembly chaperone [unclassified Streptomyces]|uniref:nitrate reductase molybdenum cofactor assembly chaperone n=1 Tax=unclassified Streptomyces TaxID=2593676 RepID=UPI002E81FDC5|nr:nitrate reductase molybdenum cofactor assembly chaperone [Streptomyces sp. NBC_00589]WTI34862.1 nitrate reductase molybdenum cofactor assembly chaperone [Streptomyces sp. NBC_00775]WUB31464.1 nitrate reductase molybdenum cofactor assembly chaperone [Streptomyces sp. NBC_00589]
MTTRRENVHVKEHDVLYQAAAYCLGYPDEEFYERLPLLRQAAPGLREFLDHADTEAPQDLAAHYVQVFDFKNRHSLYLSWWRDGDTRRRGMSLVRFKEVYREHGLEFTGEELPDFLPAVLEFSAHAGPGLLQEHRSGLELLRIALTDFGTPYATVLDAVCATLPGPSPKDRAEALALARSGPPREEVGLEPFGAIGVEPSGALGHEPLAVIGERS